MGLSANDAVRPAAVDKIRHVFVLVLENRSFDHLFGYAYLEGIDAATGAPTQADGLRTGAGTNVDANGAMHTTRPAAPIEMPDSGGSDGDPGHEFLDVVRQLCGPDRVPPVIVGQLAPLPDGHYPQIDMSGFVADYQLRKPAQDPQLIMDCFDSSNLPVLTQLAREFAVCDRWFASHPGPTWPNRYFLHAASAGGQADSPDNATLVAAHLFAADRIGFPNGTIYQRLAAKGLTHQIFVENTCNQVTCLDFGVQQNCKQLGSFYTDLAAELADPNYPHSYTFLEPNAAQKTLFGTTLGCQFSSGQDDMHPPSNVRAAESMIKGVYEALRSSPLWESSVLVITFDEHGGFYDHVPPPPAPSPNDGSIDHSYGFRYDRLGVRVPALIISPWVPRHTVDHAQYDHTSLLATVERLFGLDHLTDRDLKAADFLATLSLPQPRTNTPATLGDVLDGALVSSISAPSNLTPGQQGQVSVTLQNAGATAWTSSEGYRLGSAQPVDNTTWGASRVELPHDVAPGASVTFTFTVTAPASPQTTTMAWGMVQEQVHWFGQEASQQVVVARSPACVSMANEIASWQSQRDEAHQELQQLDFTDPTSRIEAKRLTAAIAALSSHITAMQAQMTADGCT